MDLQKEQGMTKYSLAAGFGIHRTKEEADRFFQASRVPKSEEGRVEGPPL
jgi:hypothetical protein